MYLFDSLISVDILIFLFNSLSCISSMLFLSRKHHSKTVNLGARHIVSMIGLRYLGLVVYIWVCSGGLLGGDYKKISDLVRGMSLTNFNWKRLLECSRDADNKIWM